MRAPTYSAANTRMRCYVDGTLSRRSEGDADCDGK